MKIICVYSEKLTKFTKIFMGKLKCWLLEQAEGRTEGAALVGEL
jgi:hypothetical protein